MNILYHAKKTTTNMSNNGKIFIEFLININYNPALFIHISLHLDMYIDLQ